MKASRRRDLPIVVGGCHRSGTTLVRRVLDSHSRISCGPELKFLLDFHDGYTVDDPLRHSRFTTTAKSHVPETEALTTLGVAFLKLHERRAQRLGKPRWADKNPENAIYLDSWRRLLGDDWVFVHVVRDPRDVLASMEEADFPFSGDDRHERRASHYAEYVDAARAWCSLHPDRAYTVEYEALVSDPRTQIDELMTWLGEDAEERQFQLERRADGLGDPKAPQSRRFKLNSIGRWRQNLDQGQVDAAQRAMREIGRR